MRVTRHQRQPLCAVDTESSMARKDCRFKASGGRIAGRRWTYNAPSLLFADVSTLRVVSSEHAAGVAVPKDNVTVVAQAEGDPHR